MKFTTLSFYNFRNIANSTQSTDADIVYLVGNNAQGKSNTLEAIYILAYGNSFRTRRIEQICTHHKDCFSLEGTIIDSQSLTHTIQFQWKNKQCSIVLDNKKITDKKDLLLFFPCVLFSHEDYSFVNGGPDYKRKFFNQIQCLGNPLYIETLRKYNQILKSRNHVLKTKKTDLLDTYDIQLAEEGQKITQARYIIAEKISSRLSELYNIVSSNKKSRLSLCYAPSWKNFESRDSIQEQLLQLRTGDIDLCHTRTGPHRDTIYFMLDNNNIATVGSTGQVRLVSILLKILQAEIITETNQKEPVLLIDDVLLELDKKTQEKITSFFPQGSQKFYTLLNWENSLDSNNKLVYYVNNGVLSRNSQCQ